MWLLLMFIIESKTPFKNSLSLLPLNATVRCVHLLIPNSPCEVTLAPYNYFLILQMVFLLWKLMPWFVLDLYEKQLLDFFHICMLLHFQDNQVFLWPKVVAIQSLLDLILLDCNLFTCLRNKECPKCVSKFKMRVIFMTKRNFNWISSIKSWTVSQAY